MRVMGAAKLFTCPCSVIMLQWFQEGCEKDPKGLTSPLIPLQGTKRGSEQHLTQRLTLSACTACHLDEFASAKPCWSPQEILAYKLLQHLRFFLCCPGQEWRNETAGKGRKDERKTSRKKSAALPNEGRSDKEMSGDAHNNSDGVPDLNYWHRQLWPW